MLVATVVVMTLTACLLAEAEAEPARIITCRFERLHTSESLMTSRPASRTPEAARRVMTTRLAPPTAYVPTTDGLFAAIRTVQLELDDTGVVAGWHPFANVVTRIVRATSD